MAFITKKKLEREHNKKLPPVGAWKNYSRHKKNIDGELADGEGRVIIDVSELSLSYDGRAVLEGLSFDVRMGDYICIVGDNGSGKTTLMDAILGLKKPDSGKITLLDGLSRRDMGFLPQHTEVQRDFPASVTEIVMSGCLSRGKGFFFSKKDKQIAFENMEKLGITALADRSYRELSGGQQQRVLLARALCSASRVLLLDEPITGLDPKAAMDMYSLIDDINKKDKMTIIMISHDVGATLAYASHVLDLSRADHFFGSVDEYLKTPSGKNYACAEAEDEPLYGNSDAYRFTGGRNDKL